MLAAGLTAVCAVGRQEIRVWEKGILYILPTGIGKPRAVKDVKKTGVEMDLKVDGLEELYAMLKRATAQTAHLVFDETQAKTEKPKELFFANARLK